MSILFDKSGFVGNKGTVFALGEVSIKERSDCILFFLFVFLNRT